MWGIKNVIDDIYQVSKRSIYYKIFPKRCKICNSKLNLSSCYKDQNELSCKNKIKLNAWIDINHYRVTFEHGQKIDERFFLDDYIIIINKNSSVTNTKDKKIIFIDYEIKYNDLPDLLNKIKKYKLFY